MNRTRGIIVGTAALLLPLGLVTVIGSGPAWARGGPQPGSVSCASITGTFKFSPPLTLAGGASHETVKTKSTLSSCTASGGGISPSKGKTATTSTFTSNACTTVLEGPAKPETLTTKWSPASIKPSVVAFPASTTSQGPPITITFGGPGTTGTGSYTSTDGGKASTAKITLGQTVSAITAACQTKKGLKDLTIVSGSSLVK